MKTNQSSSLQQLQDELALVKSSIENKFTLEPQRIELRNSLPKLINKIKEEEQKISMQKK